MTHKIRQIILWFTIITTCPNVVTMVLANELTHSTLSELTNQGDTFFQKGHFQAAVQYWEQGLALFECTNQASQCIELLTRLAAAYQVLERHNAVFQMLNQALSLTELSNDREHRALVRSQLSDAWLSIGYSNRVLPLNAKSEVNQLASHEKEGSLKTTDSNGLKQACSLVQAFYLKKACWLAMDSVADARTVKAPEVLARALNSQGNVLVIMGMYAEAIGAYGESKQAAEQAGESALAIKALLNELNVSVMNELLFNEDVVVVLDDVWELIEKLPMTYDKARSLLNVGIFALHILQNDKRLKQEQQIARELISKGNTLSKVPGGISNTANFHTCQYNEPHSSTSKDSLTEAERKLAQNVLQEKSLSHLERQQAIVRAYQTFQEVAHIAKDLQDTRTLSLAYGYLGQLYEAEQRDKEALKLTRQAIFFANQNNVSNPSHAQISFTESSHTPLVSPFSHKLYHWYWQQGRILNKQGKLDQAIVAYRLASQNLKPIQQVLDIGYRMPPGLFDQVIKPVHYGLADLLLQKAERISDVPAQQRLFKEAINSVEMVKVTELQDYFDECVLALQSKQTSILDDPRLQQELQHTAILYPIPLADRLVVLVSVKGTLYQKIVPITAEKLNHTAWDLRLKLQTRPHNRFLMPAQQLYHWLICPIETLLTAHQVDTLVVVPDGKLRMIPFSTLYDGQHFLIEKYAMALTPGLSLVNPQPIQWDNSQILLIGISDAVQNYPALPNVGRELENIQNITKGTAISRNLENQAFSINSFHNQLRQNEYSIIHLATHGEFESDPEHTYLLTYDEKMKMDKLQEVIGVGQFRDKPVELLTLSACKTAVGDERAALGLAGVAIKAGARSALASLWFVDDEATSELMKDFYQQLINEQGISKAKALQNVQKKLIETKRYWHPSYWGPFLLIGNWL